MDKPKIDTGLVYGTVARLLPQEGRDFTIDAAYGQDGKPKIVVTPLTAIGNAWVPFLEKGLTEPLRLSGVGISAGGQVAAEVVTIRSIRDKIEKEADAARKAKLRELELRKDATYEAANRARADRISRDGNSSAMSDAEKKANAEANEAGRAFFMLNSTLAKISKVRDTINKEALEVAKADKSGGKSWEVDMDAPLTSLFDRQDVSDKLKKKEELVAAIATKEMEADGLRAQAVNVAKQYIMQKELKNG